ncbi:MAG: DNA polymerase III subunit alpha [Clostridia bacterium]|nr:DNA polymerase III subunit alpha [Clostridia bacterium]
MEKFVQLHNHTEYSLLDGAIKVDELIEKTKELGLDAVAITDHGNMYGALQFYTGCLAKGIKPIIGCEFYMCEDLTKKQGKVDLGHLILIAKNNDGYKNLLKLNSIAYIDGYYYKPRIDYTTLAKHSKGLICLTGCMAGHLPKLILANRYEDAKKFTQNLADMFEPGDLYLEIQNHGIEEQKAIIQGLDKLSKEMNLKLVATNDCHYLNKDDAEMQDILMCVQMSKTLDDPTRLKFSTEEFYYKNYEQMCEAFKGYEDAIKVTNEIAEKCDVVIRRKTHGEMGLEERYVLPATENFIPPYVPEGGMTSYEFLRKLTFDGLKEKYPNPTQEIMDRIEYELGVISDQGFVEYFLVVWDYINYARQNNIPVGPGRGSGAGSIVAYLSGITQVDPIKYNLIFERFIHKERVSMPDFDVDFDFDKRGEVIEYVKRKYHAENVSQIITFGKMQAKNAIKDVGRVLRIPYAETDKITKNIPSRLPDGIKKPPVLKYYFGTTGKPENDKYIIKELRDLYDEDADLKRVIDIAIKLEGFPRNTSMHACGVLIAPEPVDEFVPESRNGEDITTQYDMVELESLGLLKMDFLGLKTLTDIDKAKQYIKEGHGVDIDFSKMTYDDPKVYEMLGEGKTEAVFQLESGGFQKFMQELKPTCLEDIIAGVSLYRPGPMDSIPQYVYNKNHPDEVVYAHECLRDILDVTYGCIVYQEQVMKIFQVMGGYNLAQADNVRRIMGKKKKDKMVYEKKKFIYGEEDPEGKKSIPGALKLGVSQEVAEKIFGEMESFASYAFNKSHAAAYSYLTYQTAYLKYYYEKEFLTSIINNRITNADEVKKYVAYARSEGIEVNPPHINKSKTFFSVEGEGIRYGLSGLKGLGIGAVDIIVAEREKNGEYKSLMDFIQRLFDTSVVNKKVLEALILSGACDCFGYNRSQLMAVYDLMVDKVEKDNKNKATGQFSIFDTFKADTATLDEVKIPNIKEFAKNAKLKFEKDVTGVYLSGHPLQNLADKFAKFNFNGSMIKKESEDEVEVEEDEQNDSQAEPQIADGTVVTCGGIITAVKKVTVKSTGDSMAIIDVEDLGGTYSAMLPPKAYDKNKALLVEDKIIQIGGRFSQRDGREPTIVVDKIFEIKEEEKKEEEIKPKCTLYLKFDMTDTKIYDKVKLILTLYAGDSPVIIRNTADNKPYKINKSISANNLLVNELIGVLGEDCVVLR